MRGKKFFNVSFQTRSLECFMEIYFLFYGSDGRRIHPDIYFYMDYIVLAHWIMGDGSKRNKGLVLCTDGFSVQDVALLLNILVIKFDISPTLQMDTGRPRIY